MMQMQKAVWRNDIPIPQERSEEALIAWLQQEVRAAVTAFVMDGKLVLTGDQVAFVTADPLEHVVVERSLYDLVAEAQEHHRADVAGDREEMASLHSALNRAIMMIAD